MRKILFTCMLLLVTVANVWAQENITVTGTVMDTNNEPMIGVNVSIENMPGLGAITDINGKFTIKMPPYNKLVLHILVMTRKLF